MSDAPGGNEPLTVLVVGGPTAVLDVGGLRLLTDPTFSPAGVHETRLGRPLTKTEDAAVAFADIGPVDAILRSHDQHADNLDPAGQQFAAAAFTLTAPAGSAARHAA